MNPYSVLLYIFCCLLFILLLLGRIAPNKARRDRFTLAWMITWGVSWSVLFLGPIILDIDTPKEERILFLLSFGCFFPMLVALLVNKEMAGTAIYTTQRGSFKLIENIVALLFSLYLFFVLIGMVDNPRISDEQSQSAQMMLAFLVIPFTGMWLASALQKIEFGKRGIFYQGFIMNYSDIVAYRWHATKKGGELSLALQYKFLRWISHIYIRIPMQDRSIVESILAQNIPAQTSHLPDQSPS